MRVVFTECPTPTDIAFLTQKINEGITEFGAPAPFAFFIRDEAGRMIAGANGMALFGSLYVNQLWVDKKHRRTGQGRALMEAIDRYGRALGCRFIALSTMSFQGAKAFYEKLGYVVDFERAGYCRGACMLFMKKSL